jgi:hypothetical protein
MRHALLVALLLTVAACKANSTACTDANTDQPVDPALMAFLSRARAAHHVADQAEASSDLGGAVRALGEVTTGPVPGSTQDPAAEVREVLADTLAREADLVSRSGDDERASGLIERGLGLVPTPTYFRGHLFEVRGLVEERRAARLKERGDVEGAAKARKLALDALDTAMKIQAEVIEREKPSPR